MKKIFISLIVLVVAGFAIAEFFVNNTVPSKPNKIFIGEWKRIDTVQKDNMVITKEGDGIVIKFGKDKAVALYDNNKKVLIIYFLADTTTVSYQEKTDHLIVNNGKDGEFKRVD